MSARNELYVNFKSLDLYIYHSGFTLIELVVSITIILLLVSGGITAYLRFDDRRQMVEAKNVAVQAFKMAQNQARTGVIGVCKGDDEYLSAYQISISDSNTIIIEEYCTSGAKTVNKKEFDLPSNVSISFDDLYFKAIEGVVSGYPPHQGVDSDKTCWDIELTRGLKHKEYLHINRGGEINEGQCS